MSIMTPDQYTEIEKAVEDGVALSAEQIGMLMQTINRLDATVLVFQNSLQLFAESTATAVPQLAQQIMARCGRTDGKIKKAVATMAAESVGTIEQSIQSYLVTCMLQIAQMLDVTIEELLQTGEELVEQEEPDTPAAPEQ
jgi:hypothetical protein